MMEQENIPPFIRYQPAQRERLRALVQTPEWRGFLARGAALRQWKADMSVPPAVPGQAEANEYLRERNAERVQGLLHEGVTDEEVLIEALGDWEAALADDDAFPIVFLGLVVTLDCFFLPRCLYCNQIWLPRRLTLDDWKALLSEAAEPVPLYVYLTGGEPLMLGAEVWGDDGLVAFATELGSAVNINGRLAEYPNAFCTSCAGATCVINQAAVRNLRNQVRKWLQECTPSRSNQETQLNTGH